MSDVYFSEDYQFVVALYMKYCHLKKNKQNIFTLIFGNLERISGNFSSSIRLHSSRCTSARLRLSPTRYEAPDKALGVCITLYVLKLSQYYIFFIVFFFTLYCYYNLFSIPSQTQAGSVRLLFSEYCQVLVLGLN